LLVVRGGRQSGKREGFRLSPSAVDFDQPGVGNPLQSQKRLEA